MPLVAHMPLPTFDYLRQQRGHEVLGLEQALHQAKAAAEAARAVVVVPGTLAGRRRRRYRPTGGAGGRGRSYLQRGL